MKNEPVTFDEAGNIIAPAPVVKKPRKVATAKLPGARRAQSVERQLQPFEQIRLQAAFIDQQIEQAAFVLSNPSALASAALYVLSRIK